MYEDMKAKGVQFKSAPVTITDPTNPLVGGQLSIYGARKA